VRARIDGGLCLARRYLARHENRGQCRRARKKTGKAAAARGARLRGDREHLDAACLRTHRPPLLVPAAISFLFIGNHLEYFHAPDIPQNVMALAKQLKEQRSLTLRSSGRFAVGEVGEMQATAKSQHVEIDIIADPIKRPPADPSHAVIIGIALDALLAQEKWGSGIL
jgi:hypothetical protein